MNLSDDKKDAELGLRAAAERQSAITPQTGGDPAHTDEKLSSELHVYQIELEMQNENLRVAQKELEASRDRYIDLYDFAPVGYLTLDLNGMIKEINLTAATLFGMERKALLEHRFISLVTVEDQSRWMRHFLNAKELDSVVSVELTARRPDGTVFQALLDCQRTRVMRSAISGDGANETSALQGGRAKDALLALAEGETAIHIVLTDISLRKSAEAALLAQLEELERFNRAAINRELAMIELKRQVNALSRELGRAPPYALNFADAPPAKGPT